MLHLQHTFAKVNSITNINRFVVLIAKYIEIIIELEEENAS